VTEQRLLAWNGPNADLFVTGQRERLAAAYRRRTRAVAYRAKPSLKPGFLGTESIKEPSVSQKIKR
jgi:hypothetical protein